MLTRNDAAVLPLTLAFLMTAGCGESGPQDPNNPNGPAPFAGDGDQGTVSWNNGAQGVTSAGLVRGTGYEVQFLDDENAEVLAFRFGALVEGEHDLAGPDGRIYFKRRYYSTQDGGWARVNLSDAGDNKLHATFESRTCFKDTPDANCFEQRNGTFTVFNNTGETLQPLNPQEVASGYPMVDAIARTRAEWTVGSDGMRTATDRVGVRFEAGSYHLTFTQPSWVDGGHFSLRMRSLDVGQYTLDSRTKLNYGNGNTIYAYVSDIDGGSGELSIEGNDGQFIWGTLNATACFSQTPRRNCYDFNNIRFTAAIDG